jgi:DNA mismatch endonuclease (patch repair protein)
MAKVRSTDTSPEMRLRKALFAHGYRFRLHGQDLPGKPDIVLAKYRAVIFVNGCFWHWHGCARSRMPSSNVDYWTRKIGRNRLRDERNYQSLLASTWRVLVVWECTLKPSLLKATVSQVERWLNSNRSYFSIGELRSLNRRKAGLLRNSASTNNGCLSNRLCTNVVDFKGNVV